MPCWYWRTCTGRTTTPSRSPSTSELVTVGLFGEGLRMRNTFAGRIVDGRPAGALIRGVDEFVVRPDGVGVVDARETSPGFAELGRTAVVHLGWVNMGTRELVIEGYRAHDVVPRRSGERLAQPRSAHPGNRL